MESEAEQLVNAVLKWLQTFDFLIVDDLSSLHDGQQLVTLMAWAAPDVFRPQDFLLALEEEPENIATNWSHYVSSLVHFFTERDTNCEEYLNSIVLDDLPTSHKHSDFLPILSATLIACMHSELKEECINHIFSLEDATQGLILELVQTAMKQAGILTLMPDQHDSPKHADSSPLNSKNTTPKDFSREMEQLKAENLMLHKELEGAKNQEMVLREKLEAQFQVKLERQHANHDDEMYKKEEQIRKFERRCELAELETIKFEQSLQEAHDEIRRFQTELAQKDKECADRIQSMKDDMDMLGRRATQVTVLETKCERLKKKVDQLQSHQEALKDDMDILQQDNRELKREANKAEKLQDENIELRRQMTDLRLEGANSPRARENEQFEDYLSERSSLINEKNSLETRLKAALGELEAMRNSEETADLSLAGATSLMEEQRVANLKEENAKLQQEAEYGLQDLQDALQKQKALAERYRSQYDELLRSGVSAAGQSDQLQIKLTEYEEKAKVQEEVFKETKAALETKEETLAKMQKELSVHEKEKAQLEIRVEALTQQKETLEVQRETLQIQLQAKGVGQGEEYKKQILQYKKKLDTLTRLYEKDRNRSREELKLMSTAYHAKGLEIAKIHFMKLKEKAGEGKKRDPAGTIG